MKRKFTYLLFGALFLALAAEVGCTKEDLDHYKNEGFVDIDLMQEDGSPREGQYRVHFYPVSVATKADDAAGSEGPAIEESVPVYRSFEFSGSSFHGKLPVGSYKVLIHNTDTENLALRDETDYDKAMFYVQTESEVNAAGKASKATRAGECITQPKNLFVANCVYTEDEETSSKQQLEVLDVAYRAHVQVKSEPKAHVKTVILRFKVEGDDQVALNGGTFTGVSPSHHCATATCAATSESVNFPTVRVSDGSGYNYEAEISVLDLVSPTQSFGTHTITLNIVPISGDPYTVSIDVTKKVEEIMKGNGGSIPVTIPAEIDIELKVIDGVLSGTLVDWIPGTGSGTIGDPVENAGA